MTTTSKHITANRLTAARRVITGGLTGIAFFNSYSHTTQWFTDNGQAAQAGMLAAIPEFAIIMVLITLALGGMSKPVTAIIATIGAGSVAITIWANLAGAAPGIGGAAAALVAPIFAILGFALEIVSILKANRTRRTAPTPTTRKAPTTKTVKATITDAPATPKKKNRGVIDKGILWASQQPTWPTVEEIMTQFPEVNRNTASRINNARAAKASV